MDFLTFGLSQRLTYWRKTGMDAYNKPTFAAPTQLDCRWEDRVEKIQDDTGQDYVARSRIFLGTDVTMDDYLFLGVSVATDPRTVSLARKVKAFRKTPSLDGLSFERKAYL
jgi:hypothetical protein